MTFHLAELLEVWARGQELVTVSGEIGTDLELAEAARQAWPRAVLFTSMHGRRFAAMANLWGTAERIYRGLGVTGAEELCERWRAWCAPASGWLARFASPRMFAAERAATRIVRGANCQQVVELGRDIDLGTLPWVRAWPEERLPGTAAALILLRPAPGETYVGLHAIQSLDATRLCVAFDAQGRLARLLHTAGERAEHVPCAIVLGSPPALFLAAAAHVPEELDRWQLAAAWQNSPLEMARARAIDMDVPADAELVVEGYIDPQAPLEQTGPVAGPYGWYEPSGPAAVFQSAALTRRANPVLPLVLLGPTPHELETVHAVLVRLLKPLACGLVPQLVDYSAPVATGTGRVLVAAIRTRQAFDSRQAASLLWGWGHWLQARLLILVDAWVDVHDLEQVLLAVAAHVCPERDAWSLSGPGGAVLSSPQPGFHHCLVLDATCKSHPGEAVPGRLRRDEALFERVQQLLQNEERQEKRQGRNAERPQR